MNNDVRSDSNEAITKKQDKLYTVSKLVKHNNTRQNKQDKLYTVSKLVKHNNTRQNVNFKVTNSSLI